eukprot:73197_1
MDDCKTINDEDIKRSLKLQSECATLDKTDTNYCSISKPKYILAMKLDPNNPSIYYELAYIAFKQQNLKYAEFFVTETLRFDPSFIKAWVLYSMICQKQNNQKMRAIVMQTAKEISNDTKKMQHSDKIQSFLNEFDEIYCNEIKARNKVFDEIMENNVEMQNIYFEGNHMAFMQAMMKHPQVVNALKFCELYKLRKELKYKSTDFILSLPKVRRVWNVFIEPLKEHVMT